MAVLRESVSLGVLLGGLGIRAAAPSVESRGSGWHESLLLAVCFMLVWDCELTRTLQLAGTGFRGTAPGTSVCPSSMTWRQRIDIQLEAKSKKEETNKRYSLQTSKHPKLLLAKL